MMSVCTVSMLFSLSLLSLLSMCGLKGSKKATGPMLIKYSQNPKKMH